MSARIAALPWARYRDQSITALAALVFSGVAIWLIGHIIGIVALVAVALVVALMLEPLMLLAERHMPRLVAAGAVYVAFLATLTVLGVFLGPPVVHQLTSLLAELPVYVAQADSVATEQGRALGLEVPAGTVTNLLTGLVESSSGVQGLGMRLLTLAMQLGEAAAETVFVLVLAFYLMVDGPRMRSAAARLFPPAQQPKVRFVEETIARVLGAYVRSQVVMAALMAVSAGLGCLFLGVRYPAVIGVLAFAAELIPLVGPFLAAIPAMIIAVFQSFGLMVEVTFFFLVMQTVENSVIRPRIAGPMVGLHPVEALLALVVGGVVGGFWGALFAVPAVGIAVVFITVLHRAWRGEELEFRRRGMWIRVRTDHETGKGGGGGGRQ